ncbi:MAG: hypothetical protein U9O96_00285, partial [Candidatus Thermoplasmatota archaeon]|nr:hypothetical protein [Candidatus Thermoplasmatota archaeon]
SEEIAMIIRYPSYLSMEYALSKQGILSQRVYTLTLVTTKLPYTYRKDRATYEYHQISHSLFWGYWREGTVLVAEPEKALLDLIYIRCVKNGDLNVEEVNSLVNDMAIDEFDMERLCNYSKKFGSGTRKVLAQLNI